jgi:CRISPR-associated protein Csd1
MSALASLVRAYDRMAAHGEVPPYGCLQAAGEDQLCDPAKFDGTRFGRARFRAFQDRHLRDLADTDDEGLLAFLRFIDRWTPEQFSERAWPDEMKDRNVVFALERERLDKVFIHDRPAARDLWARLTESGDRTSAACLVTGDHAPVARLHPAIKGVWDAQSSGASIVSFNLDAFTSYNHEQGDNAPVSEAAAFAYTSVLNRFLERDSGHRIQVGDASTVFWADSSNALAASEAESLFLGFIDQKDAEAVESKKIGSILAKLRAGRPIADFRPDLPQGVRFFVLALAPNASRLSVRFYIEDDFGVIAERYLRHLDRLRIDPPPKEDAPSIWRMLIETAVLRESKNIQPNLAGEWMRAILTDTPYPLTLLSTLIMRLRADHDVNALRVAILKSILIKNFNMEVPVSFEPECRETGYLLGRLFAVYEQIQTAALGRNVNATIKDKFYGAASAQPRKVFRMLDAGSANHLSKIGKQKPGLRVNFEKTVGSIMESMSPSDDPFPAALPDKSQALFGLGYYHQRNEFFKKPERSLSEEAA